MDRRQFIKTAGIAAGTTLLAKVEATPMNTPSNKRKKIVVLTGSPRRNGNTNHLAMRLIQGAEEAGHEVFRFDCARQNILTCRACNACGMDGDCVLKDDFVKLRPHLLSADLVAFVTPMYYFGFSAQLKRVVDRFYSLNGRLKGASKEAVLLMAYANTAPEEAEPIISHYKALLSYLGWQDRGMVVAPGMWPVGAVNDTTYSQKAYELGKSL